MIDTTSYSEATLTKVHDALNDVGVTGEQATEAVSAMQNRGVLFRERVQGWGGRILPPEQMSHLERAICAGMMGALDEATLIVDGEEWVSEAPGDDIQDGMLDIIDETGHVIHIEFTVRVAEESDGGL